MVKESLGLLEVAGLLGAISASDAMVKAANVRIVGIEKEMCIRDRLHIKETKHVVKGKPADEVRVTV